MQTDSLIVAAYIALGANILGLAASAVVDALGATAILTFTALVGEAVLLELCCTKWVTADE